MQNDKELTKKKTDLLRSLMKNPKLARTFRDAMSAPIGSTKREQAKTILSIMKKVGGLRNDGRGGPMPVISQNTSIPDVPNYSNMMIFPAAPKFKTKKILPISPSPISSSSTLVSKDWDNVKNGLGGLYEGKGGLFDNENDTLDSTPGLSPSNYYNIKSITTAPIKSAYSQVQERYPALQKEVSRMNTALGYSPIGETTSATPVVPTTPTTPYKYSGPFFSPYGESGPVGTPGAYSYAFPQTTQTKGMPTGAYAGGMPSYSPPKGGIAGRAQQAVDEMTGAGFFAMGIANEKFGGGLDQYLNNLDKKLKTDFNLDGLETELSNLKAKKGNLIPTLNNYIQGKDQYLKFIDSMIDKTNDKLLTTNLADPFTANQYKSTTDYLYTLKGRQEGRYANYLNSAIADYEADVERTQSNYENVYNRYNTAMTRGATIAQNEYNTLYTTMSDLYNNLQDAPIRQANLRLMNEQLIAARLQNVQNAKRAITGGTDEDLFTQTQLNSGASNAGMSIPDFMKLNYDVKNFFVNNPQVIDDTGKTVSILESFQNDLKNITAGADKKEDVIQRIADGKNLPQDVKNYLINIIEMLPPSEKPSWIENLWNRFRGKPNE